MVNPLVIACRHAYSQAFEIFVRLCDASGRVVECALDAREHRLVE